jgi:hypothetical protein
VIRRSPLPTEVRAAIVAHLGAALAARWRRDRDCTHERPDPGETEPGVKVEPGICTTHRGADQQPQITHRQGLDQVAPGGPPSSCEGSA